MVKAKDRLKSLYLEYSREKTPDFPDGYRSLPTYFNQAATTNGLTKCIIAWFRLHGWHAERITSSGRVIDNTKQVTDVLGRVRKIGSTKYIPGTSMKGTADIEAFPAGFPVKIEVKNAKTKDRQSAYQKGYEAVINASGGVYYIATNLDSFAAWYDLQGWGENNKRIEFYHILIQEGIVI